MAVLSVVAVIGVVMYANTDADVADAAPMHGRKALRMDKLHRVKSHAKRGRCPFQLPSFSGGVEVSDIELKNVASEDGLFWKTKSDPYVTLVMKKNADSNGWAQQTLKKKNAESVAFDDIFCFEGKQYIAALEKTGIKVTVMDDDSDQMFGGGDDELASVTVEKEGLYDSGTTTPKCNIKMKVTIFKAPKGAAEPKPTRKAQLIEPLHTASSLVHPRRP